MKNILVIGSVYTEIVNEVKELPKGNEEFETLSTNTKVNGEGFLATLLLQKFGFQYTSTLVVGQGYYSTQIKEELDQYDIPYMQKDEMNGCVYTLVDQKNQSTKMLVPGCEYELDLNDLQEIDASSITNVLLFGDMLCGSHSEDIIQVLDDLDKPILFIPNGRIDDIDENIFDSIMALQPELYLSDTESYYLLGSEDINIKDGAKAISDETKQLVLIYKQGLGIYVQDTKERRLLAQSNAFDATMLVCAYALARYSGLSVYNSLVYADEFTQKYQEEGIEDISEGKELLARLILGK